MSYRRPLTTGTGTPVLAVALIGMAMVGIAGCEPVTGVGIGVSSLSATKKLPTDHLISSMTGRDCSVVSYEKTGEYCPPPPREIDRSDTYCFKTLGGVECHDRPDPYRNRNQSLASPLPKPVTP
ncbi:hypothetical protein CCP1ISM_900003 [Azospirillaceae bacterium]